MIEVLDESPFEFSFAKPTYSKDDEDAKITSLRVKDTTKAGDDQLSGSVAKNVLKRYVKKIQEEKYAKYNFDYTSG